jgi:hypothetical protein
MFRLFPSHHQGACYMAQRKKNVYIFQDTVIYIRVLQFQFTMCHAMETPLHQVMLNNKTFVIFYL